MNPLKTISSVDYSRIYEREGNIRQMYLLEYCAVLAALFFVSRLLYPLFIFKAETFSRLSGQFLYLFYCCIDMLNALYLFVSVVLPRIYAGMWKRGDWLRVLYCFTATRFPSYGWSVQSDFITEWGTGALRSQTRD